MGLLDSALSQSIPKGQIAKPLMIALGALLVSKMVHHGDAQTQSPPPATPQPAAPPQASAAPQASQVSLDGGLLGGLGGLVNKLQNSGHGEIVNSWTRPGPNQPIQPGQLGAALGPHTVGAAAQQAGINEQELLTQLARNLPQIVSSLTANGRMPTLQQLAAAFLQK